MICSGAVSAQFIAGKATRDALYLANLDVTTLPSIVIGTAALSILLVFASSRGLQKVAPATFVPVAFALSGLLLFASWLLTFSMPVLAARLVYLQISGLGPMLGSSFWLIASERFDPHTARHHFGRIAAVGTLAGLGGALVAERVAVMVGVSAMLPVLAVVNLFCAWQIQTSRAVDAIVAASRARGAHRPIWPRCRRNRAFTCWRGRRICATWPRSSCSARLAPRWSTTSSRPRPSRRSDAAKACSASSRSTTPASACSRSSSRRRRVRWRSSAWASA